MPTLAGVITLHRVYAGLRRGSKDSGDSCDGLEELRAFERVLTVTTQTC